jgi:hypothetical protein
MEGVILMVGVGVILMEGVILMVGLAEEERLMEEVGD